MVFMQAMDGVHLTDDIHTHTPVLQLLNMIFIIQFVDSQMIYTHTHRLLHTIAGVPSFFALRYLKTGRGENGPIRARRNHGR